MAEWLSKWDIRRAAKVGYGWQFRWWVGGWSAGERESVYDMNNESLITKFVITGFSAI